jgi:ATP/ADP translocase
VVWYQTIGFLPGALIAMLVQLVTVLVFVMITLSDQTSSWKQALDAWQSDANSKNPPILIY